MATINIRGDSPHGLAVYQRRVFWLEKDRSAALALDSLGKPVPRRRLAVFNLDTDERTFLSGALPPALGLAANSAGVWLRDPIEGHVMRIDFNGEKHTVTTVENHLTGALEMAGERLAWRGKIHPGAMGVAVYREERDHWEIVLDTEDPTLDSRALTFVGSDRVFHLRHQVDQWLLDSVRIDGGSASCPIELGDHIPRELSGHGSVLFVGTEEGIRFYRAHGELLGTLKTTVPPERLTAFGPNAIWVAPAVHDVDGDLVQPWQVQGGGLASALPETLIECEDPIMELVGAPWGFACITRPLERRLGTLKTVVDERIIIDHIPIH